MKVLVVHAHPDPDSFGAAVRDAAMKGLTTAGHDVTLIDLEAEDYPPCLTAEELERYDQLHDNPSSPAMSAHMSALKEAEALVFTYPTFWTGLPAVLKGWLDRTMVPGVAFSVKPNARLAGELRQVRHVIGVTTYGSPRTYRWIVGDGGRRTIRTVRSNCGLRCRMRWLALDELDARPDSDRRAFLVEVEQHMAALR